MTDVYTDSQSAWSNLLATGYDRLLEYQLRSEPVFRQLVDKHPADVTNPGASIVLTVVQEITGLATTPLTETADVSAVTAPNPNRVTLTLNEYGNVVLETLRLKELSFTAPDPALAYVLGKNMVDTIDSLVKAVVDASTHIIGLNGGVVKTDSSGFAEASVASTDVLNSAVARDAVALLRRRNVHGRDARDQYMAIIHPDVSVDIMSDTGWLNPHQYVDTSNIYAAEIGSYLGARYMVSPRCTTAADGVTGTKVYRTYYTGQQALAEATAIEPHTVIGNQIDRLKRFFPLGWYSLQGWAIYRTEAIQIARTASSIAAL